MEVYEYMSDVLDKVKPIAVFAIGLFILITIGTLFTGSNADIGAALTAGAVSAAGFTSVVVILWVLSLL